jgi:hypothetical protein
MDTQAAAVSPAVPASLETQQERTAFPLAALTVFAIGILTAIFPMPVIQQLAFVCSASTTQLETCVRDVPMAFSEMLLLQRIVQCVTVIPLGPQTVAVTTRQEHVFV